MNIAPCSLTSIGGASEGAATVLAFLGCKMPENSMITGFVDSFGLTKISHSELMNEPIHKIDCLKSKALGAGKCRLTLLFPEENAHEFGKDIPQTLVDDRFLIKHVKDYYLTKGTEVSYQILLALLYGKNDNKVPF